MIQARRGQNWEGWMTLETIDYTSSIGFHPLHDALVATVPNENIAAIAAADDEFGMGTEEIDTLHSLHIPDNTNYERLHLLIEIIVFYEYILVAAVCVYVRFCPWHVFAVVE